MATTKLEVKCIKRAGNVNAHEHVTHIGGIHLNQKWEASVPNAIARIEAGTHQFFVTQGFDTAEIGVVKMPNGTKYLRTIKDGTLTDNLLSLPECS
jgi:hypothetical protein